MPSQTDNEKLAREAYSYFKKSRPGSPQAIRWRRILKNFLYFCGFEVGENHQLQRRKKVEKDDADYSFEVEK